MVARRRQKSKVHRLPTPRHIFDARGKLYSVLMRTTTDGPQKAAAAALSSGALILIPCNQQT